MNKQLDILMATYNGGSYIEQQILSLIWQTHKDWVLYIRDDGSTDNTIEIINKYVSLDKRIKLINDKKGNLGVCNNFLELLQYSNSDYFLFCDQDDIWFENKIEELLKNIDDKNNSIPQLVYCGAYNYNLKNGITGKLRLVHSKKLNDFLFINGGIQGSSSIYNKKLKEKIENYKEHGYIFFHDMIFNLCAILFGEINYLDKNLMLYRQHDNNITENQPKNKLSLIIRFLTNNKYGLLSLNFFKSVVDYYRYNKNKINLNDRKILKKYTNFPNYCFIYKLYFIMFYNIKIYGKMYILIYKILFKKNLY